MVKAFRKWWGKYLSPDRNAALLALAVLVGLTSGGGVWLFRQGIDFFQRIYRDNLAQGIFGVFGVWAIIPVLGLAGLIVGLLMDRFIGEERHHGVAGIIESTALAGGRLRYQRMPIKAALASFSLGAGASVGPEDPSVQIGANLGSMFGQWLHLSDDRIKLLVAAGAASGIASAFRSPIAGVFFALETILGDFSTSAFGVVVLAAVIASVFTQAVEAGTGPELGGWSYALGGIQEIPLYILLGLLMAPVSALFIKMLYWQHDFWHHRPIPRPVKTLCAGLIVGLIAVFLPQIMGTGRDTMNQFLDQKGFEFAIMILIALGVGKMLATTISLGGGFVGGMFAPSLFVGAALGRAYGQLLTGISGNHLSASPAAFAIAGMAATMTGIIRAPITAVILLFELTNDYNLILPIMLTTVVCLFLVERLAPDGIYQLGLARKGVRLSRRQEIVLMQAVKVQEVMTTNPQVISAHLPLDQAQIEFDKTHTHGLIVTDSDGLLYGILTLEDMAKRDPAAKTVGEICTRHVMTVVPEDTVDKAFQLIAAKDVGRLPVVDPQNPRQVIGLLRRRDVAKAYDLALQKRLEGRYHTEQLQLASRSNAHIIELRVNAHSPADEHMIRELALPGSSVIASIWRQREAIVPTGDTLLHAGDILTVVTTPDQEAQLAEIVKPANGSKDIPTPV